MYIAQVNGLWLASNFKKHLPQISPPPIRPYLPFQPKSRSARPASARWSGGSEAFGLWNPFLKKLLFVSSSLESELIVILRGFTFVCEGIFPDPPPRDVTEDAFSEFPFLFVKPRELKPTLKASTFK